MAVGDTNSAGDGGGRMLFVSGGILAARGFVASAVRAGLKTSGEDVMVLLRTTEQGSCAALLTTSRAPAWCVRRNRRLLDAGGDIRALVVNSGNANAATGEEGRFANEAMVAPVAFDENHVIGGDQVLTASTGIIGHVLPVERIFPAVTLAMTELSSTREAAAACARAILTTDLVPKEFALSFELEPGRSAVVGGIAKGSGMIAPNMATMLAFVTTDVAVSRTLLNAALKVAADLSFHCLTVDGDTSTNDMLVALSSGAAGNEEIIDTSDPRFHAFAGALMVVCLELAKKVARDGEGATKLVTVMVRGARSADDAKRAARSVAESPLVKTALFGCDPNWGRILMALGKSGADFDGDAATIALAGTVLYENGAPTDYDATAVSQAMRAETLEVAADLRAGGDFEATFYTCDYSYDYIRINAEYHT